MASGSIGTGDMKSVPSTTQLKKLLGLKLQNTVMLMAESKAENVKLLHGNLLDAQSPKAVIRTNLNVKKIGHSFASRILTA